MAKLLYMFELAKSSNLIYCVCMKRITFCNRLRSSSFCHFHLHDWNSFNIFAKSFHDSRLDCNFNKTSDKSTFPETMLANIIPEFKEWTRNQKDNHLPVSILPVISKIFERFVTRQLSLHFQVIISKVQNQHGTPFI